MSQAPRRTQERIVTERGRRRREWAHTPSEGVRIIGADEAAEVLDRHEAEGRRPSDEARPGDRPEPPAEGGPAPALRFPLESSAELEQFEPPTGVPVDPQQNVASGLSHWAESAPEEVPNMSPHDPYEGDEAAAWSAFAGAGPRWRDDEPPGEEGGGRPRPRRGGRRPSQQSEPMVFDDYQDPAAGYQDPAASYQDPAAGRSVFDEPQGPGSPYPRDPYDDDYRDQAYEQHGYADGGGVRGTTFDTSYDDSYADEPYEAPPIEPTRTAARPRPEAARPRSPRRAQPAVPGDRDMRQAVGVGVGLIVGAVVLAHIDPVAVLMLVVAILGLASLEYFTVTREAGFDPLMPAGVAATVGLVIAAYYYGNVALPLILVLTVVVCLVWYLIGAGGERPMANVGATLLGVCWIGLFGSYAGLLLTAVNGEALLAAAIVPTIGYDVGALFVGRSTGSRPLSAASPNKTVEGLAGGMVLAVVAGLLLGMVGLHPFGWSDGLKIGLVAAAAAPLGDLSQSLLKRDLGIKDMGKILPGHGGLLDRFDGLLFVLPAIYYLAVISDGFIG